MTFNNGELESRSIESLHMSILSKISTGNYNGKIILDTSTGCDLLKNNVSFSVIAQQEKVFDFKTYTYNYLLQIKYCRHLHTQLKL